MILVVGGMGFIGQNVTLELIKAGEKVVSTQHNARRVPGALEQHLNSSLFVENMDFTKCYEVINQIQRIPKN